MALLPSIASYSPNVADRLTNSKPLPTITHQRIVSLIGADHPLASATPSAPSVATATVAVVASAASVPSLHPNLPLPTLDTGDSVSISPSRSDFLPVAQAPYGLIRSAFDTSVASNSSVASDSKAYSKVASTPVDPYTLITGEDTAISVDLSSPDTTTISDLSNFTKVSFDIREFGTATLTFIYSKSTSELLHIFVDPTQIDWLHWAPLPRLILPESYFHIFGLDYLHAFTLLHLIPIWIYCLLHFAVNLED